MIFNETTKTNQKQRVEALFEITQSDKCEIKFKEITWDIEKPIRKLKGLNETPDFTITFGINKRKSNRAHIVPDHKPSRHNYFDTTYTNFKEFNTDILAKPYLMMLTKDILEACSLVMVTLGINCYLAHYNGEYGWLKLNPENKIQFLSAKSIEIDIETIKDTYLTDSSRVPEFDAAILIETNSDHSYYIALNKPDEFGMELATRRMKLENVEPLSAS